ncbi:SAICAR synthase-like protein [Hypoxylon crocopeplum]|nr:SAICAR synthase-like protein [Hypoxylon crocopeplum]
MSRREKIARSIVYAILNAKEDGSLPRKPSLLARILRLFSFIRLTYRLVEHDLFTSLRGVWEIREDDYRASFDTGKRIHRTKGEGVLTPMGDMGYSGSTFFCTNDGAYLVKSIPRHFEHNFFKNELLMPYANHMRSNPSSLLVRITDFLESTHKSIGILLGLSPTHHVVMENIMYGHQDSQGGLKPKWESWDLKPTSYFYPERDVAGGVLATEATKSKLADEFNDKIRLSKAQAAEFKLQLEKDTMLLEQSNSVDYSLFLVRISATDTVDDESRPLLTPPNPPSWRTGIISNNKKTVYRAAILDFFWAKHTVHAKAMTALVNGYNLIDEQGPMSITTDSKEYRDRFLKMCMDFVEVEE